MPDNHDVNFTVVPNRYLGGCFYDHICSLREIVVGIRYYVDRETEFSQHPVLNQFFHDKRFSFNQDKFFVDIFFGESCFEMHEHGSLHIDCVQEFGGESIVKNDDMFGICLRIANGTQLADLAECW
ncbi:MAG: hypothetical protein V4632_15395 [Pseudomonadota bacterium]